VDDVVDVNYSIIYKKLKPCNSAIELTIFDDAGHDSWTRVYDNREIYDWMFEQIKKNLVNEKYSNTATFLRKLKKTIKVQIKPKTEFVAELMARMTVDEK
jgi:hypothetical protein